MKTALLSGYFWRLGLLMCGLLSGFVATSPTVHAEESESPYLFGDVGGLRPYLEERGIAVNFITVNDLVSNVSGGQERGSVFLGSGDLSVEVDTEKAGLWSGGRVFTYLLGLYGREPSRSVGDWQFTDGIEGYSTVTLLEAWYEHSFLDGQLTVLGGLYDFNSEFNVLDYAGTLMNSSFLIQADIIQVIPPTYSTTSLATRVLYNPTGNLYIQSALFDGVPGDPEDPRGTQVILKRSDGFFWANEAGYRTDPGDYCNYTKLALGFWRHTAEFVDYSGQSRDSNQGYYVIGERSLWREAEDASQGLGAFFQAGFNTRRDRNQLANYWGAGLSYTGAVEGRPEDVLALGVAVARNGSAYIDAVPDTERAETALELTYRAIVLPYLTVQPDLQYVIDPGMNSALSDAWVLSIRTEIAL